MKKTNTLYRFGISLEQSLIDEFDQHIATLAYKNRSEAIRDLIRQELVKKHWDEDGEIAGAITMIYDHHKRDLVQTLMSVQHDYHTIIISTQHVHLDHHNCLEILAVKGNARHVQRLADMLKSHIGVKHVTLHMSTTGEHL
ncbi:MAG: nickel-responsive transcriptional regulator NikR [Chitinivibrionales bacterium]|nr:nickel-responsive transcriptional regulator NikR [Chitinivibrionales bacterium]